jgi:hypothetical protein
LILAGGLLLAGGPRHPGGTTAEMLADPEWIPAHTLMLAGFLALLTGLVVLSRDPLTSAMRRWVRLAIAGAALQAVEMVFHTLATFDHANLMAGRTTPILSTHLALAVVAYPLFAASTIGLIVMGARERALGSRWISWIGVIGAVGHGVAAPLTVLTAIPWARRLFPAVVALALWMLLAALWPRRSKALFSADGLEAGPRSSEPVAERVS